MEFDKLGFRILPDREDRFEIVRSRRFDRWASVMEQNPDEPPARSAKSMSLNLVKAWVRKGVPHSIRSKVLLV